MSYSKGIIDVFEHNPDRVSVWVNSDKTDWRWHQRDGFIEVSRDEVMGGGSDDQSTSTDMNVKDAVKIIETIETLEDLEAFTINDDRKGVLAAVEEKMESL